MLSDSSSPLLRIAAKIALTHHERWDGGGFPLGLAGDRIPIEGRITAVADVFEGLCIGNSDRWSLPLVECFDILLSYQGTYFDPKVVDAFVSCRQDVLRIQEEYYSMT